MLANLTLRYNFTSFFQMNFSEELLKFYIQLVLWLSVIKTVTMKNICLRKYCTAETLEFSDVHNTFRNYLPNKKLYDTITSE